MKKSETTKQEKKSMTKIEARTLYGIIRRLDAKGIDSATRSKMLAATIATKKCAQELEEAEKTVNESATEKEREADRTVSELRRKLAADKSYVPSDKENEAVAVMAEWKRTADNSLKEIFEADAAINLKKLTDDELDSLAGNNSLSFDELALMKQLLVE